MPAQQRLRAHQERVPTVLRQHPTQRRKQKPIVPLEPRSIGVPAKNRQLVSKHANLQLFRPITSAEEHDQLQQPSNDDVQS
jgi:hypothetical protein